MQLYIFHYNTILPLFGAENTRLVLTDTDSVAYEIKSDKNPYELLRDLNREKNNMDFSNFDPASEYYSEQNKLCPGKVKDDFGGRIIKEIVALRAKMYSILSQSASGELQQKSTAKGLKKYLQKKNLHHKVYKDCLFGNQESEELSFYSIKSKRGKLYTIRETKKTLNTFNDKRHNVVEYNEDNYPIAFKSFAFGHKAIRRLWA